MSENTDAYTTYNQLAGADKKDSRVQTIHQAVDASIQAEAAKLEAISKPMPEKLAKCVAGLKTAFEQYFSQFGISEVRWPEHAFYTQTNINAGRNDGTTGGAFQPGMLVAREVLGVKLDKITPGLDKLARLKEFTAAVSFAHELFHASSLPVFVAIEHQPGLLQKLMGKDAVLKIRPEKIGLSYVRSKKRGIGSAIEEGWAMKMQIRMEEELAIHYPDETKLLKEVRLDVTKILDDPDFPIESISPFGNLDKSEYETYRASVKLVNFLEQHIPQFEKLSMRAKVLHETLPLARSIENVFGENSFTIIMQADEKSAPKIQRELTKRVGNSTHPH